MVGAKENFARADAAKCFQQKWHPANHRGFQEYIFVLAGDGAGKLYDSETPICPRMTGTSLCWAASSAITPGEALLDIPV